jgi:GPH family glycoside/pentoside/hexuronide:cation symporter
MGDFGFNLAFQFTQVYASFVFAELFGLSGGQAALIFLLARIWDAINDPLMGGIAERTQTRWGTFRPWILWSILPLAASILMLFYAPPGLEGQGAFFYALGAYVLFSMSFTVGNIPYGALTARLSKDYLVRSKLSAWRMTLGILGGMIAVGSARPLSETFTKMTGSETQGWFFTACVLAGLMAVALLITFLGVKEDPNNVETTAHEGGPFGGWSTLSGNKPFWFLTGAFVLNFLGLTLLTSCIPFFFEHYLHDKGLEPIVTAMVFGVAALSVPFWAYIAKKSSKRNAYIAGALLYISGLLGVYFLGHLGINTLYASFFLVGMGAGASAYAGWAMLPDTVEYGEWKNGKRNEGAVYGVYGFFFKLGIGLGAALFNLGRDFIGYDADLVSQTTQTEQGFRALASIAPAIAIFISIIVIFFYKLGPASHAFILTEIRRRKIKTDNPSE